MKRLLLVLLLVASNASAEFSGAEKAEIRKVGNARNEIAMSFKRASETVEHSPAYIDALQATFWAHYNCFLAWGHLLNSPGISGYFPDRATRVQDAFRSLDTCQDRIGTAIAAWTALGASGVAQRLQAAQSYVASFDRGLSYMDWKPPSYPGTIGPHSDWQADQRHLHRFGQYGLGHTVGSAIGYFADVSEVPPACYPSFAAVLVNAQQMTSSHIRGWALYSGLVFSEWWGGDERDDVADILAMHEASNQIRPTTFFEVPLGAEYLWSKRGDLVTISGRKVKTGVSPELFQIQASFANLVECVTTHTVVRAKAALAAGDGAGAEARLDEIDRWWTQGGKNVSPGAAPGRAKEFFVDIGDGWNDHDQPASTSLGFFHGITIPPDGTECDPETTTQVGNLCVGNCPPATVFDRFLVTSEGLVTAQCQTVR